MGKPKSEHMRQFFFLLVLFGVFSCGDKKPEPFGKPAAVSSSDTLAASNDKSVQLGQALFMGVGMCKSCHLPEKKVIGPSITEIATIYKDKGAAMVAFLKGDAEPIVDPSQYDVMKTNFAVTKTMSDEELKALEAYMYSFLK